MDGISPPDAAVTEQDKRRARWAVQKRVQRGRIVRPPACEKCDRPWAEAGQWEAHHPDYAKKFDVLFLCRPCHREVHADADIFWDDIPW